MIIQENEKDKMILYFSNGDIEKFNAVMEKYKFKDAQAFIRFATSLLLVTQDNQIKIKKDNDFILVEPVSDLIKEGKEDGK